MVVVDDEAQVLEDVELEVEDDDDIDMLWWMLIADVEEGLPIASLFLSLGRQMSNFSRQCRRRRWV